MEQELFSAGLLDYATAAAQKLRKETSVIPLINDLEATHVRLNMVMNIVKNSLWEYDVKTKRFCYINQRLSYTDLGVRDKGLYLDEWMPRIHLDDIDKIRQKWREALALGEPFRVEYRERFPDGKWHWVLSAIQYIARDEAGAAVKVMGIHIDITNLVHARLTQRRANTRLKMIYDNAGLGIALAAPTGRLTQVNPAVLGMSGYGRTEMVGSPIMAFSHPDDVGNIERIFNNLRAGGTKESVKETRFVEKGGGITWLSITATKSRDRLDHEDSVILLFENVTESHNLKERLRFDAEHDQLTNVHNRRALLERLSQSIEFARRYGRRLIFVMTDIDHFKSVNDKYGHQVGDKVLAGFARILAEEARRTDVVGRYGGEEFGIILPEVESDGVLAYLHRVRGRLSTVKFTGPHGERFSIAATFGVALYQDGMDMDKLVFNSDTALYQGKQEGRDRIVVHMDAPAKPDA